MERVLHAVNDNAPSNACRRLERRSRVLLTGKIVFGKDGSSTRDCRIRDLSENGARVVIEPSEPTPPHGLLIVVKQGMAHHTQLVWESGKEFGFKFLDAHDLRTPGPTPLSHARSLWLETATRPMAGVSERYRCD